MEDGTSGGTEFEVPDTSPESFAEAVKRCQSGLAVIFNEQDRKDGKPDGNEWTKPVLTVHGGKLIERQQVIDRDGKFIRWADETR
jgi:hypothetical protein